MSWFSRPRRRTIVTALSVGAVTAATILYAGVVRADGDPPANDDLAAAVVVPADAAEFEGSTENATVETGETGTGERSVWFRWTAPASGGVFVIPTAEFGVTPEVYAGSEHPLATVDSENGDGGLGFVAEDGMTYVLRVSASADGGGAFAFTLWQPGDGDGGPGNDDFVSAVSLDGAVADLDGAQGELVSGTMSGATMETGEPGPGAASVWYSYSVVGDGSVLTVSGSGGVTLAAYSGPHVQDLTEEVTPTSGEVELAGDARRVFLRVSGGSGDFTLSGQRVGYVPPDLAGPEIECVPGTGWTQTIEVPCTASDSSGLADDTDASFVLGGEIPDGAASENAASESRTVCDAIGNCAPAGPVIGLKIDRLPPVVACDPAPPVWVTGDVGITCRAEDAHSGLADSADAEFTLTAAGVEDRAVEGVAFTIRGPVCDAVGNCIEVPVPPAVDIDQAPPVIECEEPPTGWHGTQVTVSCTASDEGSGLADPAQAEFELGSAVPQGSAAADAQTAPLTVCDAAGLCTEAPVLDGFSVDLVPPVVECDIPPEWTAGNRIEVECVATDEGSGIESHDESFTLSAGIEAGTQSPEVSLGSREVCDKAGNCTNTPALSTGLDDRAPDLVCEPVPDRWIAEAVSVTCNAADPGGSGIEAADESFLLSAGIDNGTTSENVTLGSRTVCDAVGNCATTPDFAPGKIDRVLPQAVCDVPSGPAYGEVTVTCTAGDVGSGLADPERRTFTLRTDVGPGAHDDEAYTNTRQVCDIAGNCITAGPVGPFDINRADTPPGGPPVLTTPGDIRVLAGRPAPAADAPGAAAAGAVAVPYDVAADSEIDVLVGCTPASGASFPLGRTSVSCTARDAADRTSRAGFAIAVESVPELALDAVEAGQPIAVAGIEYAGPVAVTFEGDQVATLEPEDDGEVGGTVVAPARFGAGSYDIVLSGVDQDGRLLVTVLPVTLLPAAPGSTPTSTPTPTPTPTPSPTPTSGPTSGPGTAPRWRLVVKPKPKRDRKPPFKFKVRTTVQGPSCAGTTKTVASAKLRLQVTVKKKGKKVRTTRAVWRKVGAAKRVPVSSACTNVAKVKVKTKKLAKRAKRVKTPVRLATRFQDHSGRALATKTVKVRVY